MNYYELLVSTTQVIILTNREFGHYRTISFVEQLGTVERGDTDQKS